MSISSDPIATPKQGAKKAQLSAASISTNESMLTNKGMQAREGVAEALALHYTALDEQTAQEVGEKSLAIQITGAQSGDRNEMIARVKSGLAFEVIEQLEQALQATRKEVAHYLSIPISTLTRRKKEGQLHGDESDRVVRLANLKDEALKLMQGDNEAAITWLRTPLEIFCGETPLERARTELGGRDVENLIGRIRHGVFS